MSGTCVVRLKHERSALRDEGTRKLSDIYSAQVTKNNPAVHQLALSWRTAKFTDDDGTGPMESLHQAGDSIVAVTKITDSGNVVLGSGVMVAPGILLTATHVLNEFPRSEGPPAFMTFLPNGARIWLPIDLANTGRPSAFHDGHRVQSDLSVVSCTLNSDVRSEHPLMLAPMEISLPLLGERLWAVGFRHHDLEDDAARLTPLVASGLVTAAYPQGRGERMPATCIEVAMDTPGGMSGGPVMNARGNVIGIVSSAFDGGPSYVTLLWDVLRLTVKSLLPWAARRKKVSLISVANLGDAKLIGTYKRSRRGDVVIKMSAEEMQLLVASSDPSEVRKSNRILSEEEIDQLLDESSRDIEARVGRAALEHLEQLSPQSVAWFLAEEDASGFPAIKSFQVEDFEGVEDLEVLNDRENGENSVVLSCAFDLLSVVWTVNVDEGDFLQLAPDVRNRLLNVESSNGTVTFQAVQRCYFECDLVYAPVTVEFLDATITAHGIHRSK